MSRYIILTNLSLECSVQRPVVCPTRVHNHHHHHSQPASLLAMRSSTGSRGSSRSVTNILNGAASVGTLDGSIKSGPLTGTASLHNSKLSINSQGSQQSHSSSQRPIQEEAGEIEPTFLEKAKFYTSLCMGE